MFRVFAASMLAAAVVLCATPAVADMRIVSAKSHQTSQQVQRYRRSRHATAFAIPRCRMVFKTSYHVHWRGLACPKIAWAGSAPRQPWSYAVFRHKARWEQRSDLWQSHIRPSHSHPTIYWGY